MDAPELPAELVELIARYDLAFLVSIGESGPHTTPLEPALTGARFRIPAPGPVTCRNIAANPAVTLLWPPPRPDTHALIIDGHAALEDGALEVLPSRAVLHHVYSSGATEQRCSGCRRFNLTPAHRTGSATPAFD
ncbi:pyridoxamine 5'-phosphate oxidase family protein [Nocardia sp. NPDC005978]|uniref:pyridoxamine 5'-phosphate oxidase family protein n=1 Tax=unclassified Nocardia TaxID=2637762 RepID=UPI0033A05460